MLASSSLFDGSAHSSIMPLSASSEQAPTSQPPRELVERFEWPVVAKEIAHRLAAPNSILLNFTRTLKMSTHCSGIDTPVWAARVVERFSNVRFDVCSACECAPAAQKALTQVPGGHKHMFIDVLNMLQLAVKTEVDQVIKSSAPNDLYKELSSIIMRTELRECAKCRAFESLCHISARLQARNGGSRRHWVFLHILFAARPTVFYDLFRNLYIIYLQDIQFEYMNSR